MLCPHCSQEHPDEAKFCPTTGRRIETASFCRRCGTELQPDWAFCAECREPTGAVPTQAPVALVPPYRAFPRRPARLRTWLVWVSVTILAVVLILLVVDPFRLRLIGRLFGGYDAAASVMPVETDLYVGINLLNTRPAELDRLAPLGLPFAYLYGDELDSGLAGGSSGDTLAQIDQTLQDEFGVTLSQDVMPWIGQYAGVGLSGITEVGGRSDPTLVIAFEARSAGAADRFLEKLASGISEKQNTQVTPTEYSGVSLYVQQTGGREDQLVFGRSGRMVLFASGLETMQQAIDAQGRDSLADDPAFRELVKHLPRQHIAKVYLSAKGIREVISPTVSEMQGSVQSVALEIVAPSMTMSAWQGSMLSISLVDAGLQFDTFNSFDLQGLSASERQILESGRDNQIVNKISSDAIAYISGEALGEMWDSLMRTYTNLDGNNTYDYATVFEQELGFDPRSDLFAYLNKEWALEIVPTKSGLFAEAENLEIGYFFIAETDDSERLQETFRSFTEGNAAKNLAGLVPHNLEGGIIYEAFNYGDSFPVAAYGLHQGYFVIGSSERLIEEIFNARPALSGTDSFRQATAVLPGGDLPTFYVDVQALLDVLRQQMPDEDLSSDPTARYLESIGWIAATHVPLAGGVTRSTLIINVTGE